MDGTTKQWIVFRMVYGLHHIIGWVSLLCLELRSESVEGGYLPDHPARNGYPTLFRAGDREGGKKRKKNPISVTWCLFNMAL